MYSANISNVSSHLLHQMYRKAHKPNDICIKMDELFQEDFIQCGSFWQILRFLGIFVWLKFCQNITFSTMEYHYILT